MNNTRVLAAWGAGVICRNYLANGLGEEIEVIIDNDSSKTGNRLEKIPIVHPSQIVDWKRYFIIIVSRYEAEIAQQLEEYGLVEGVDFASYKNFCSRPIPLRIVQETLQEEFLQNIQKPSVEVRVRSKEEYDENKRLLKHYTAYEKALNRLYKKMPGKLGGYWGKCVACEKEQNFIVDYVWSDGKQPAWRETVTCPECNCNSRMRFVIDYIGRIEPDKSVFMYEYVTNTFLQLKKRMPNLVGSEYLGEEYESGQIVNGILHEDAMNLSFAEESFDYMISNDVLEHVADYKCALKEAYRCLKKNGHFVFSIPIFKEREETSIRTRLLEGKLEYLQEAVYHGNPLSSQGSLVFAEFGWDILKTLKSIGFSDAYAIIYCSADKGYFGDCPVIFEAVK